MIVLLALSASAATPEAIALEHVAHLAPARAPLHVSRVTPFPGGDRVRLAQTADGLPVWGAATIVVLDGQGGVRRVVGAPAAVPADLTPTFPADDAIARVDAHLPGTGALWAPRAELGVHVREGVGRLVWQVEVSRRAPLAVWRARVDAHSGVILGFGPALKTADGTVYETNPFNGDPVDVDLGPLGDELAGDYAMSLSCISWNADRGTCNELTTFATADALGDFRFDPDDQSPTDPFAEVMMYHHVDRVARWFEDLGFRHDRLTGMEQMQAIANIPYNNAFFGDADGDGIGEIAFGQTGEADFSYDADVIYHEFTHSVFNVIVEPVPFLTDEYGTDGAPDGLDEGSADWFAIALTGDPLLGEYAGRGFGFDGPVRDLSPDPVCPHDIYGESHEDGKIWAGLGWNLIDDPLLDGDTVALLALGAISEFPPDVSWKRAGKALLNSADDLRDARAITPKQHEAVIAHVEASGLAECERVIPLEEVKRSKQWILTYSAEPVPLATQFSLDAPAGTTALTFRIDELTEWSGDIRANVYVRRGEHVKHTTEEAGYLEVSVPTKYDWADEDLRRNTYELVLDDQSELVLEPGETYYFAVAISAPGGFARGEIKISGEATITPASTAPSATPTGESSGGCGCSAAGAGAGWLGALALLVLGRRRR